MISNNMALGVLLGTLPPNAATDLVVERGIRPTLVNYIRIYARLYILFQVGAPEGGSQDVPDALYTVQIKDWTCIEYEEIRGRGGRRKYRRFHPDNWKLELLSRLVAGDVVRGGGTIAATRVREFMKDREEHFRKLPAAEESSKGSDGKEDG